MRGHIEALKKISHNGTRMSFLPTKASCNAVLSRIVPLRCLVCRSPQSRVMSSRCRSTKSDTSGSDQRQPGQGRLQSARRGENVAVVADLVSCHDDKLKTHSARSFRTHCTRPTFENKTHALSRSYFTNCFAEYEQRTLYGALVVTLTKLLRLINGRFIIIIY